MIYHFHHRRKLARCDAGVALIEFALMLPVLLVIFFGTIEMARMSTINLKLDKAANTLADLVTQGPTVSTANLDGLAGTLPQIMRPFSFNGYVIFTSAVLNIATTSCPQLNTTAPCISWQYSPTRRVTSQIGRQGGRPRLPGNYAMKDQQNAIVVEVFYSYAPLLDATSVLIPSLRARTLYKAAMFKPRPGGSMSELVPSG